eukprot:9509523-Alexandrium_andersonii.AAC.1
MPSLAELYAMRFLNNPPEIEPEVEEAKPPKISRARKASTPAKVGRAPKAGALVGSKASKAGVRAEGSKMARPTVDSKKNK